MNRYAEAEAMLSACLALPGVKTGGNDGGGGEEGGGFSEHDRCSVFVQMVEVKLALDKLGEAAKLMSQATFEFAGSSQEGRLTLIAAAVEVAKGEIEGALSMLRGVPQENPNYLASRRALAKMYLDHRNDKRAYAQCHEEVAAASSSAAAYVSLGDAYMAISEPEKAIGAFKAALERSPGDGSLASRIGGVLVTTHEYVKAIEYFSEAMAADPSKTALRFDLAKLYLELKKHDLAAGRRRGHLDFGRRSRCAAGLVLLDIRALMSLDALPLPFLMLCTRAGQLFSLIGTNDLTDTAALNGGSNLLDDIGLKLQSLVLLARAWREQRKPEQLQARDRGLHSLSASFTQRALHMAGTSVQALEAAKPVPSLYLPCTFPVPSVQALEAAKLVCGNLVGRARVEAPELLGAAAEQMAGICMSLAELHGADEELPLALYAARSRFTRDLGEADLRRRALSQQVQGGALALREPREGWARARGAALQARRHRRRILALLRHAQHQRRLRSCRNPARRHHGAEVRARRRDLPL
jgi:tetratricopeptide (TPR) repeat protein